MALDLQQAQVALYNLISDMINPLTISRLCRAKILGPSCLHSHLIPIFTEMIRKSLSQFGFPPNREGEQLFLAQLTLFESLPEFSTSSAYYLQLITQWTTYSDDIKMFAQPPSSFEVLSRYIYSSQSPSNTMPVNSMQTEYSLYPPPSTDSNQLNNLNPSPLTSPSSLLSIPTLIPIARTKTIIFEEGFTDDLGTPHNMDQQSDSNLHNSASLFPDTVPDRSNISPSNSCSMNLDMGVSKRKTESDEFQPMKKARY
jgi:hypothetical protein